MYMHILVYFISIEFVEVTQCEEGSEKVRHYDYPGRMRLSINFETGFVAPILSCVLRLLSRESLGPLWSSKYDKEKHAPFETNFYSSENISKGAYIMNCPPLKEINQRIL